MQVDALFNEYYMFEPFQTFAEIGNVPANVSNFFLEKISCHDVKMIYLCKRKREDDDAFPLKNKESKNK